MPFPPPPPAFEEPVPAEEITAQLQSVLPRPDVKQEPIDVEEYVSAPRPVLPQPKVKQEPRPIVINNRGELSFEMELINLVTPEKPVRPPPDLNETFSTFAAERVEKRNNAIASGMIFKFYLL